MRKAFLQLHLAIFLAGFTGVLGRLISLQEGMLVLWRLLLSAVALWTIYLIKGSLQPLTRRDQLTIIGIGGIAALHWVTFFGSIKYANISVGLVCFSAVGFFTALLEPLVNRKSPVWSEIALGALVMGGILIIFHFDPRYQTGILLGMVSALLGALFPIYNRRLMQRLNAPTLITWELSGGLICLCLLLPLYSLLFPAGHWWPSPSDWIWLGLLSGLCTVWAFQLSANALRKLSAFTVNLSYNLEPVYGILMAFVIYQENKYLGRSFYVGLLFILLAVAAQSWRVWRRRGNSIR